MTREEALDKIDATLRALGFSECGPGVADYEGAIPIHGQQVDIQIKVPDPFFVNRPQIYLKDRSQIPLSTLAHIETETGICFASALGLPIDIYEPGQAVLRMLEEASRTLETSYAGRAAGEVVDEYQAYWRNGLSVRLMLDTERIGSSASAQLSLVETGVDTSFLAIHDSKPLRNCSVKRLNRAVLWKLSGTIGPTNSIEVPGTLAELKIWMEQQPALGAKAWRRAFQLLCREDFLFLLAPNAMVGMRIEIPKDVLAGINKGGIRKQMLPRLLGSRAKQIALNRYEAKKFDMRASVQRNLGNAVNLGGKDIALIGCGTIGSHLGKMLVQSGAGMDGRFCAFDPQSLSESNIGRHLLGHEYIGKGKTVALKAELERFHPYLEIEAQNTDAVREWAELEKFDIVIDATGDWNVQNALNELFLRARGKQIKAMLHCWVYMNGAAAQSFLNLADEFACFRCLKPDFAGPWRFPAARPGEELTPVPANCGEGAYVPFSVDASVMAACLANRAALDWASGKPGSRLRTAVTDYARGTHQKPRSPTPAKKCPACGTIRDAKRPITDSDEADC